MDYKQSTCPSPITEKPRRSLPRIIVWSTSRGIAFGSVQNYDFSSVSYGFFEGLPPHQGGRHGDVHHVVRASSGSPGRQRADTLHWELDVVVAEDAASNRKDHGPQNLAVLRRLVLNVARADKTKGSLAGKLRRAAWDEDYLVNLLAQTR